MGGGEERRGGGVRAGDYTRSPRGRFYGGLCEVSSTTDYATVAM